MGLLRLWLAFEVLRYHATSLGSSWMPIGQAAVQAFFVLSGFAMAMVLEEKYGQDRRRFWIQRFIKLWPSYFAAALIALAYEGWLYQYKHTLAGVVSESLAGPPFTFWAWVMLGFSNVTLLGQDFLALVCLEPGSGAMHPIVNPFAHPFPASHFLVLPQAWSLSIEFAFYALAPWYVRLKTRTLVLVFLGGLLARGALIAAGLPENPWAFRLTPVELSTFSLGILSWRFYRSEAFRKLGIQPWLGCLAGWVLILAAPLANPDALLQSLAVALACALALPWIFGFSKSLGWDRIVGEWAYPFYLLHILVCYVGMDLAKTWGVTPRFWALGPGCLLAAALFWLLIRVPLNALQKRLLPR